jgi:hypothetical protein
MSNADSPSAGSCLALAIGGFTVGYTSVDYLIRKPHVVRNVGAFLGGAVIGYCATSALFEYLQRDAPLRSRVELFLEAEDDERLAEECVSDMTLDSSTLVRELEVEIDVPEPLQWDTTEVVPEGAPPKGEKGETEKVEPEAKEEPSKVVLPSVVDATAKVEVRASRALIGSTNRMTYTRRVYDACKVKFGTPKNTEANYKAVWRYAGQLMKEHGMRPSHQAKVLPGLVSKVFVPTVDEMLAQSESRVMRDMMEERFDECVSRWERWSRKCQRLFGLN